MADAENSSFCHQKGVFSTLIMVQIFWHLIFFIFRLFDSISESIQTGWWINQNYCSRNCRKFHENNQLFVVDVNQYNGVSCVSFACLLYSIVHNAWKLWVRIHCEKINHFFASRVIVSTFGCCACWCHFWCCCSFHYFYGFQFCRVFSTIRIFLFCYDYDCVLVIMQKRSVQSALCYLFYMVLLHLLVRFDFHLLFHCISASSFIGNCPVLPLLQL